MNQLFHLIRCNYIDRFDPTLEQAQLALRVTCALLLAIILVYALNLQQPLWIALPAPLFSLSFTGPSRAQRYWLVIIGCVATAIGVFIASLVGPILWAFLLFSFLMGGLAFYLTQYGMPIAMTSISAIILVAIAGSQPVSLPLATERLCNLLLSAAIICVLASTVFPYRPHKRIEQRLRIAAYQLKQLSEATLLSFICGTPHNTYREQRKDQTLSNLQDCRSLIKQYSDQQHLMQWRILFSLYNSLNSMWLLFTEPGSANSFNQLSRYLFHIHRVLENNFVHLNIATKGTPHKALQQVGDTLLEASKTSNEDIASLAFLIQYIHEQFEAYHALDV